MRPVNSRQSAVKSNLSKYTDVRKDISKNQLNKKSRVTAVNQSGLAAKKNITESAAVDGRVDTTTPDTEESEV